MLTLILQTFNSTLMKQHISQRNPEFIDFPQSKTQAACKSWQNDFIYKMNGTTFQKIGVGQIFVLNTKVILLLIN